MNYMHKLKEIKYDESRAVFFENKLKVAKRSLENAIKHKASYDECSEKSDVVSYYEDAIEALRMASLNERKN